jgi:cell division septation protein DedD
MSYQFGHVDRDERIDYGEAPPYEDEPPLRRSLFGPALVLGVMALFAGGLWFAYHEGTKHPATTTGTTAADNVPLIRADPDPVKVKPAPDKIGGLNIPDKDNPLYGARPGSQLVEKILPPPEVPAPRPPPAPPQPPPQAPPAAVAPPPPAAAAPKPSPSPPAQQATAPGGVRVQLASVRSTDAARDEWTRLRQDNSDLLGKLSAVAVRADLGERGIWYKIEVGPLPSKEAAARLCGELKQRDLECQLVR